MGEGREYEGVNLRFLLDQLPVLIGYVDKDLVYRSVNRAYESMLGRPRSSIIGQRVQDVLDPEAYAIARPHLERALQGELVAYESRMVDAAGEQRDTSVSCAPDCGTDGQVLGLVVMVRDRTEESLAAAALRASEGRFRNLADHVPVMIWISEADGRLSYLNRPWSEFTGQRAEEGLGIGWLEVVHPEDRAQVQKRIVGAVEKQTTVQLEYRLRRRDGTWRWVVGAASPRKDESGGFVGHVGSVIDITEHKHVEQALRESERFLAHLLSQLPGAVYRCRNRPARRMEYVSPGIRALTGYPPEDFCSGRIVYDDLVHPEDRPQILAMIDQSRSQYDGHEVSYRLLHADGSERRIWESGRGILDGGRMVAVEGFLMDVTAEHELQASLNRSLGRTRLLSQVGVLLLDAHLDLERTLFSVVETIVSGFSIFCIIDLIQDGEALRRVAWAHHDPSADLAPLARFVPPSGSDHPINQVLHGGRPLLIREADQSVIEAKAVSREHADFIRSLGVKSLVVVPLLTRHEAIGVLTLCRTIHDGPCFDEQDLALGEELGRRIGVAVANARLYQNEREARELAQRRADQLISANAELEQFAYIASHDMREPMRMVTQYLDLLQRRYDSAIDDEAEHYLNQAMTGALRMQDLMRDLLDYTRIGRSGTRYAVIDLQQVAEQVVESMRLRIAEANAAVTIHGLPPAIRADPVRVALLLQNLIENALTFIHEEQKPRISITAQELPEHWQISVSDNGIGIEPQFHALVFEVFRRLHPRDQYTGTGIGLSICRKIVEQHQGRIWVESALGSGATIHFTLAKEPEWLRDAGEGLNSADS